MPPRLSRLLAPLFVILAFALSAGLSLWLRPLTWRVQPLAAGLAVYLLLLVACAVVPAGVYALITGAFRDRPAGWESDPAGRRFSVQSSPRQAAMLIAAGSVVGQAVPVERVPNEDQMRIAQLGVVTWVFFGLVAVLMIDLVLRSMTSRPSVVLTPDGLTLGHRFREQEIRWDELRPGGPPRPAKRNPGTLKLLRSEAAPLSLPAGVLQIDTAFLAHTIRRYVEHPDRRPRIGDAAELAELQRGFAAEGA
ncbi:hypothetical protein KOI35_24595 [Actinoplanes bogorensis]|uniref:PH domain-containing protein n=1 Tax=Paractinoplanes bogorensis TaxID=1610840 RepID=A0ABS5YTB5_9ACTN|nr:hypothetical protein [Actinoplanes bogorensis]MBU2666692.1 hypothetical protein [Actinoplanes bogorensis]